MRFAATALAALVLSVQAADAAAPNQSLGRDLRSALASPALSLGRTSAFVLDRTTGATVFAHNATLPLAPASNEKLPVAFTALARLGPNYRFHTDVLGRGTQEGSVWYGDLILKGYGDPTLTSADLRRLAAHLAATGLTRVTGRVLGDESAYDTRRGAPGWKRYFIGDESPPLSALVVDRARGWPALSPALLAASAFTDALEAHGLEVRGSPGLGRASASAVLLQQDHSVRLAKVVRHMNSESDNFYAEMLLKQLPIPLGKLGTTARGARMVLGTLGESGVDVTGVRIVDGSGLSSLNRLTTRAVVGLLVTGAADPRFGAAFSGSLAEAGRSGTLARRLPQLRGVVRGKTGTTDIACSLSGLVSDRYAFAIFENGNPVAYWAARTAQDRFVTILARR